MLRRRLAVICLAVASVASPPAGVAQPTSPPTTIAVLDIDRILEQSRAAQSVRPQVDRLRKEFQAEVKRREGLLREADEELKKKRSMLTPEAYAKRRRELEERAKRAQADVQSQRRRLEQALNTARAKLRRSMLQVVTDLAGERKIDLVLPRTSVVLSARTLDITVETLERLDEKLPSIEVRRPEPPEE